ncbi:MAG: hypothetical protein HON90_14435 [Halobacteriovoraceae bacterium]|jgi:hypothetical protein|nr:hypothetical protein [Halobacteriovoraceae bacterium]
MKKFLILTTYFAFFIPGHLVLAKEIALDNYIKSKWKLSKSQKKYLLSGEVLAQSQVVDNNNAQDFTMQVYAYHKKNCHKVIRKLSLLENYSQWVDFIKSSTYQANSHLFTLTADHPLLPFPMLIHIIVERPTKIGTYTFSFPTGIFRGLQGHFEITEQNNRCLLFAKSHWQGQHTKIPNFIIELFSETLSKIGGHVLMRKVR